MQDGELNTFAMSSVILSTCAVDTRVWQVCTPNACHSACTANTQPQQIGERHSCPVIAFAATARMKGQLRGRGTNGWADLRFGRLVIDSQVLSPCDPVGVIWRRWSPRQVRSEGQPQQLFDVVQLHGEEFMSIGPRSANRKWGKWIPGLRSNEQQADLS